MLAERGNVRIDIKADSVVVVGETLATDRSARLFLVGMLGATVTQDDHFICRPRGSTKLNDLALRVNTFLERQGWSIARSDTADAAVTADLTRRRSFQRTRDAAREFRQGRATLDIGAVRATLQSFGWNSDRRALKKHQEDAVLHALTAINAANFSVPGAGKTAAALAVATVHLATGTIDAVLVVGPLACFTPWEREAGAALSGRLNLVRARGTTMRRREIYRDSAANDLLLMSYPTAAADKGALVDLMKRLRVMLIVDESHRVKRFRGGLWAPALAELSRWATSRMILSGTPMPQSGRDLFSQLNILWPGAELTGARDSFATRVEKHFPSVLADVTPFVHRTSKDQLGLPPYSIHRHEVELSGVQAEIYDLIFNNFRQRVEGYERWADKIEALKHARPLRLIQAATNPLLLNKHDRPLHISPIEMGSLTLFDRLAALSLGTERAAKPTFAIQMVQRLAERGEKAVCWTNFISNADYVSHGIRALNIPVFQVDGRVLTADDPSADTLASDVGEPETREALIDRFLNTEGPAALVATPPSCSESVSLHGACRNAIYIDRTYDCAMFLQSIDRIHRLGLPPDAKVEIHILRATRAGGSTIDHLVDASLLAKEATMKRLLEGSELTPLGQSDDAAVDAGGSVADLEQLLRFLLGEEV